jgi:MoxR-like ATPase
LDRFLMKVLVRYPTEEEERKIYRMTSTGTQTPPATVLSEEEMLALQAIVHKVPVSDYCVNYVATLIRATRHGEAKSPQFIKDWIQWGVGPRGGQSIIAAAQARAALDGRPEVTIADIKAMATPVLRHRIVLNYNAEAQGQTAESVIQKLLAEIPVDAAAEKAHERISRVLKA